MYYIFGIIGRVYNNIIYSGGNHMSFELNVGMEYKSVKIVEEKDTAAAFGSGSIFVFSTPSMIALMENAAMMAVEEALGEEYSTVGTHLDISHLAATPMGKEVYAVATLKEVEGKKLKFYIEAFDEKEKIGEGYHSRYVIDKKKFMERVANK